jgi:adenylate cyclase
MVDLDELFAAHGVPPARVAEAEAQGQLETLALEQVLLPGVHRYDLDELCRQTDVPVEVLRRIWRAMGFPDLDPHERAFTDADLQTLQLAGEVIADRTQIDRTLQQLRVVSASLSRIAEMTVDDFMAQRSALLADGATPRDVASALVGATDIDRLGRLFLHLYRRQLLAAIRRRMAVEAEATPGEVTMAVGFIDLVGFTALTQELESDELGTMVSGFEAQAYEAVAARGGRVVKTIGDEVMYVCADPGDAVDVALSVAEARRADPDTLDVRAGVAFGLLVPRDGDYYGTTVNLASRLVNIAYPGSVLVSEELHHALDDDSRFDWRYLRPRRLKGIGRVGAWAARPPNVGAWAARPPNGGPSRT